MGALDDLQSFVKTNVTRARDGAAGIVGKIPLVGGLLADKIKPPSPSGGQEPTRDIEGGWPFVNYAFNDRVSATNPLVIPRLKYTYLVEFHINPAAFSLLTKETNLVRFINNGKMYIQLKRIDHPKPSLNTETLRSYNKYVKLPTKVEFQPASMTFDDDSTSMTAALIKEYMSFYSHMGNVGFEIASGSLEGKTDLQSGFGNDSFSYDQPNVGYNHLVANGDTEPRKWMNIRPSVGLKLKSNNRRTFFDNIVIYDLGTEPDSVNVYYFYKPVITNIDHGNLDTEDRTSKVEVNMTFEYENYYFVLGQNRDKIADIIERATGTKPPKSDVPDEVSFTHGDMDSPIRSGSIPVSTANRDPSTPTVQTSVTDLNPQTQPVAPAPSRNPDDIDRELEEAENQLGELASQTVSQSTAAQTARKAKLNERIEQLRAEKEEASRNRATQRRFEQANVDTQSALNNTKNTLTPSTVAAAQQAGIIPNAESETIATNNLVTRDRLNREITKADSDIADLSTELNEGVASGNLSKTERAQIEEQIRNKVADRNSRQLAVDSLSGTIENSRPGTIFDAGNSKFNTAVAAGEPTPVYQDKNLMSTDAIRAQIIIENATYEREINNSVNFANKANALPPGPEQNALILQSIEATNKANKAKADSAALTDELSVFDSVELSNG